MTLIGSISVSPPDVTLDITNTGPPAMQAFKVTYHDPNSGDRDVTVGSSFALSDISAGIMSNNVFTTGTAHGGDVILTASYTPPNSGTEQGQATIHIRVKGSFPGPDCGNMGQPACPTFPGDTAPACPGSVAAPNIVYPPDGVLLPPNMSVISVMWTPFGNGVQSFEVDFKNNNTDVRVVTTCATQTQDTQMMASGGCELQLTQAMWDFIAKSNRGGDPVAVTVRATSDGSCATPSANTRNISFAQQDLNGGLFYWKSTVTAGQGVGGNIFAKSFGDPTAPEVQITGMGNTANLGGCFGCHALSRDGSRMVVSFDDNDSDDEDDDVSHTLMDVATKNSIDGHTQVVHPGFEPGFQAIAPDLKTYIASNGIGTGQTNIWYMFNAMTGTALTPPQVTFGPMSSRPTMPDFAPDGKSIVYVLPASVGSWDSGNRNDDTHVFGGSLYTASFDTGTQTFGMPTALITSQGENNYYPGFSPDGAFVVYNRVEKQPGGTACTATGNFGLCPNDSFSNPKARIWILSTKQGAVPIDAEKANGSPAASPIDYSNSWPRWSPFVQMYKGNPLLWVTFSSTRDYGLRILNHKMGFAQCYPADSYQDPGGAHKGVFPAGCQQPQIWMAAINLQTAEVSGGGDPSYPAFWLPYQDITKHNHTAQWTQTIAGQPMPDAGACIPNSGDCTANPNACCSGTCLGTGVCGMPIP
jgi:hypothetical protein